MRTHERETMKLDIDLVRQILFQVEDCEDRNGLRVVAVEGYAVEVVDYHVVHCVDKGLITGARSNTNARFTYYAVNLTPSGHDFVAEARNDTFWQAAKVQIRQKGLPATIDVLKTVLGELVKAAIGLN